MQRTNRGALEVFDASNYRIAIVVAQFNADITEQLLASAQAGAKQFKIPAKNIVVYRVAGSVEIPAVLKALAATKKFDALVALGAIIRGETDHYDYVAKIVTEGVLAVMMESGLPIGFGVLTCNNIAQAKVRVSSGAGAVAAVLRSAKIIREVRNGK